MYNYTQHIPKETNMLMSYILAFIVALANDDLKVVIFSVRIRIARACIDTGGSEQMLDHIESNLREYSGSLDLPYIRPELSKDGKELLARSPVRFVKLYVSELRKTCRGGGNFLYL